MRAALTATTLLGTVMMARQGSRSLILVVEGDDDHFLINRHLNDGDVILIGGSGRPALLEAASKAARASLYGVRFLVDADYDRFVAPMSRYPTNVVASKYHDAIVDLIAVNTSVLDRVIDTYGRSARRNGATFDAATVREEAVNLAASLAPLRIVNERHVHRLRLRGFPFGVLSSIRPTASELATVAINRSPVTISITQLTAEVVAEKSHVGVDPDFLMGDHDLFGALSRVFEEYGVKAGADSLWNAFLAAVFCREIGATEWYQTLARWGEANGRSVFACECAA